MRAALEGNRPLVVIAIGTLLSFAAFLLASSAFFVVPTSVENRSDRVVRVALFGVTEGGGIAPLPLREWQVVREAPRFVELAPGEAHQFHYDWDDINYCWIVIADDSGFRVQRTGLELAGCPEDGAKPPCCGTPELAQVLTDVSALLPAPAAIEAAARRIP
ncbi:MAG: hypothetical protein QM817_12755 [Archangium sp.]